MPSLSPRPLYREILNDAWNIVWHRPLLWLLAIAAGLLQTGGIADVFHRLSAHYASLNVEQTSGLAEWGKLAVDLIKTGGNLFGQLIIGLKVSQAGLLAILFGVVILGLAILCQGALVYLIGTRGRFTKSTLGEGFAAARKHLWSIIALALLPLAAYGLAWFVLLSPFGKLILIDTPVKIIAYVIASIIALIVGFICTSLHMLALQNVILEETHLNEALRESWWLIKRSWISILETGGILFVIGIAIFIASTLATVIVLLPLLAFVGVTIILQAPGLTSALLFIVQGLLFVAMMAMGGFTIAFQYATWHRLHSRIKKGLAIPKIVRIVHQTLDKISPR